MRVQRPVFCWSLGEKCCSALGTGFYIAWPVHRKVTADWTVLVIYFQFSSRQCSTFLLRIYVFQQDTCIYMYVLTECSRFADSNVSSNWRKRSSTLCSVHECSLTVYLSSDISEHTAHPVCAVMTSLIHHAHWDVPKHAAELVNFFRRFTLKNVVGEEGNISWKDEGNVVFLNFRVPT